MTGAVSNSILPVSVPTADQIYCLPLLGVLLRSETRKL